MHRTAARLLVLAMALAGCNLELVVRDDRPREEPSNGGAGGGSQEPGEDGGERYALPAKYAPLEAIVERPAIPGLSSTAATTLSPYVYVVDLEDWLADHPVGTPVFDAVMLHEQVHARRQEAMGVDAWRSEYLMSREFMWAEEQLGWYVHIQRLKRASRGRIVEEAIARNLSKYRNLRGRMVDYDAALAWVKDVVAGRWRPPE